MSETPQEFYTRQAQETRADVKKITLPSGRGMRPEHLASITAHAEAGRATLNRVADKYDFLAALAAQGTEGIQDDDA